MNGSNRLATALVAALTITSISASTPVWGTTDSVVECPAGIWPNTILIPHEYDCTRYYVCFGELAFPGECAPSDDKGNKLYFDEDAQACVWSEESSCVPGSPDHDEQDTTDESPDSEDSNTSEDSSSGSSSTEAGPEIPTKCPPTNEGNATHIAHESDCGLFYKCNHGKKILRSCPPGLAFNPVEQLCDWPHNVGCTPGGSGSDDDNNSTPAEEESWSGEDVTPNDSDSSSSTTEGPNDSDETGSGDIEAGPEIPTECPPTNEGNATHIAHESDCGLFWKCNHGEKILQRCPAGLAFNPVEQVCDWPHNVGCIPGGSGSDDDDNSTPADEESSGEEDVTPNDTDSSSSTTEGPNNSDEPDSDGAEDSVPSTTKATPEIPTVCPPTNEGDAVHIAHESNCSLFYKCDHGRKIVMSCPAGLLFNPVEQLCDWPFNVECPPDVSDSDDDNNSTPAEEGPWSGEDVTPIDGDSSSSTTEGPNNSDEPDSDGPEDSVPSTTEAGPEIPTKCPPTNEGNATHIAHESDCGLFYKCNHGKKILQRCPDGLAFNPIEQVCDWPHNVGCIPGGSGSDDDDNSTPVEEESWSEEDVTPNDSDSASSTTEGPNNSDEPDSDGAEDSVPSTTEAGPEIPIKCPPTNEGNATHIAHESDCGLFYKCNHGKKILQRCPNGLAFNPAEQVCDWPHNVGCTPGGSGSDDGNVPSTTEEESWSSEDSSTEGESLTSTTEDPNNPDDIDSDGAGDASTPSSTTEAAPEIPTVCPPTNEGGTVHIAHESDCGLFYKCDHGRKIVFQCPGGLAFNPVDQRCDWPQTAGCTSDSSSAQGAV